MKEKKKLPAGRTLRILSEVLAVEAGRQAAAKMCDPINNKIKAEDTRKRIAPLLTNLVDELNQNLDPKRLDPSQKFYLLSDTQPDDTLKNGQNTLGFALVYSAPHELQGFEWQWNSEPGHAVSELHIRYYAFANQGSQSPVWVEHKTGFVTHTPFTTGLARYGHAKFTVPFNNDPSKPIEITATLPLKDPETGCAYVATHSKLDDFMPNLVKAFDLNKLTAGKIATGETLIRFLRIKDAVKTVVAQRKPKQ